MRVAVVGAGYVGSVTAAGLASIGHDVAIHDLDAERVTGLLRGAPAFHEPGLRELVASARSRLRAAASSRDAVSESEIALICVNTPATSTGAIDVSRVDHAVAEALAGDHKDGLVVVIRSTVIPGTAGRLRAWLDAASPGPRAEIAVNPEFLREGRAVADFLDPDRIVIGCASHAAVERIRSLYHRWPDRVMVMSPSSAELAKYANNALLALLVSYSNDLAELAEAVPGADVIDALRGVHADRRWRTSEGAYDPGMLAYLWPGCGYGGSCLPKDVKAIVAEAAARGVDLRTVRAADETNERQARRLVDLIQARVPLSGLTVAVLGLAFKAGTTDPRSSPGIAIASALAGRGASVRGYDPLIDAVPFGELAIAASLDEAIAGARVWVVVTHAPEFEDLPSRAERSGAVLVDPRRRYMPTPRAGIATGLGAG